ncbi:MAG TPA: type II toxin-antitoxin system prevent-host-death family antitoxin [Acidobacteriaceae bacterium]|nr:type II toxin-antitoxin system prevent-host-death family antitoxin [Acidobacteriaceae bacterium]
MTVKVTIFEAKTNLSALLKKAQQGQTVIITSGRERTPIARIEPIAPAPKKRRLGSMLIPGYVPTDAIFEPLPKGWSGEDE